MRMGSDINKCQRSQACLHWTLGSGASLVAEQNNSNLSTHIWSISKSQRANDSIELIDWSTWDGKRWTCSALSLIAHFFAGANAMLPLDPTETVKVDRGTHHSGESAQKNPWAIVLLSHSRHFWMDNAEQIERCEVFTKLESARRFGRHKRQTLACSARFRWASPYCQCKCGFHPSSGHWKPNCPSHLALAWRWLQIGSQALKTDARSGEACLLGQQSFPCRSLSSWSRRTTKHYEGMVVLEAHSLWVAPTPECNPRGNWRTSSLQLLPVEGCPAPPMACFYPRRMNSPRISCFERYRAGRSSSIW